MMRVEVVARSRLGGEYISKVQDGPFRRHWLYRDREPAVIEEVEVAKLIRSGELSPDGTICNGWEHVDNYILSKVEKANTSITDLPPSLALARASVRVLRKLQSEDASLPVMAELVSHLLQAPSVAADDHIRRQLLGFLQQPKPRPSRPQPIQQMSRFQVSASYFSRQAA